MGRNPDRNQQRDDRIGPLPAKGPDQRAPGQNRDRGPGIGKVVQKGRADIRAVLRQPPGQKCCRKVDHQRQKCQRHHDPARDRRRIEKPHHRFRPKPERDHDQHGIVYERRDHLGPRIAEGHPRIRRPPRDPPGGEGDDKGRRVRQVMDRIRDQGDRTRQDAADDLRHGQKDVDHDGQNEPAFPGGGMVMVVVVIVRHDIPCHKLAPGRLIQRGRNGNRAQAACRSGVTAGWGRSPSIRSSIKRLRSCVRPFTPALR